MTYLRSVRANGGGEHIVEVNQVDLLGVRGHGVQTDGVAGGHVDHILPCTPGASLRR